MNVIEKLKRATLKDGQVGDIYKVTFDMNDLQTMERVNESELTKRINEKENEK